MLTFKQMWELTLYHRLSLIILLVCNILGTIYGFIWYGDQLLQTKWYFLPFIPDSPIASLFLCIAIITILLNRSNSIIDALAFVSLLKYGLWAVIMNIIMINMYHDITIMNVFLIMSHSIMALEAIYFYPRFKVTYSGFLVAMIWVFHNDFIDYVLGKFPYYGFIAEHSAIIGYIAFWLSVFALIMYYSLNRLLTVKLFD
ncbi:DUF1405 domain-containing protein [Staphylococcus caledonicus]|uniref:DUF1405 domain-containing protein n=1 Tax=Staphylococcus caledonicus TaxID=2741333 RepID=UPI003C2CA7CC